MGILLVSYMIKSLTQGKKKSAEWRKFVKS